eukprot:gene2955-12961_t
MISTRVATVATPPASTGEEAAPGQTAKSKAGVKTSRDPNPKSKGPMASKVTPQAKPIPLSPSVSNAFAIAGELLSKGNLKLTSSKIDVSNNSNTIKLLSTLESKMAARGRTLLALPLRSSLTMISMELAALPMRVAPDLHDTIRLGAEKAAEIQSSSKHGYGVCLMPPAEGRTFQVKGVSDAPSVARALMKQIGLQHSVTLIAAGKEALSCALSSIAELRSSMLFELGQDCGFTTEFVETKDDEARISAFYRLTIYKMDLPLPSINVSKYSAAAAAEAEASGVEEDEENASSASSANAARRLVGSVMNMIMKRPKVELHLTEADLPFTLRSLVRVGELLRQGRGGNVVALLQPKDEVLEEVVDTEVVEGVSPAPAKKPESEKVVIMLLRTKLPDLSSAVLPVQSGVVKQYTPQDSLQKALRAQMLNLGSWNARLDSPRALPTTLAALRGVDADMTRTRGSRVAFVPEMVLEEGRKGLQTGGKWSKRSNPTQRLMLHFIEIDSTIMDILKPRQSVTQYKVQDVPHLNQLVRTAALYNSFPTLRSTGVLGLHAYLNEDNLLYVGLCKDPMLDTNPSSVDTDEPLDPESPDAWPSFKVAASTDETNLARGVLAEMLARKAGDSGVILRSGYGEPVKVAMVAAAMAAPPLQDQTDSRILIVPKVSLEQEMMGKGKDKNKGVKEAPGTRRTKGSRTLAITLLSLHKCPLTPEASAEIASSSPTKSSSPPDTLEAESLTPPVTPELISPPAITPELASPSPPVSPEA